MPLVAQQAYEKCLKREKENTGPVYASAEEQKRFIISCSVGLWTVKFKQDAGSVQVGAACFST